MADQKTTTGIRSCRTCKWVSNPGEFAECHAPQNRTVYLSPYRPRAPTLDAVGFGGVEDKPEPSWRMIYCTTARANGGIVPIIFNECGRAGRWWKANDDVADWRVGELKERANA